MVVSRGESLAGQGLLTVCAVEAFTVKWHVFVSDATLRNYLDTLSTFGCEVVLIAWYAKDLIIFWDEALASDRSIAAGAKEAILMELLSFIFHFLHSWLENLSALITSGCECLVVAFTTVQ